MSHVEDYAFAVARELLTPEEVEPLEVRVEVGYPLAVVITVGGPYAAIECRGFGGRPEVVARGWGDEARLPLPSEAEEWFWSLVDGAAWGE